MFPQIKLVIVEMLPALAIGRVDEQRYATPVDFTDIFVVTANLESVGNIGERLADLVGGSVERQTTGIYYLVAEPLKMLFECLPIKRLCARSVLFPFLKIV